MKNEVAYYPGCASHGIAKDVDIATQLIAKDLNLELVEVEDWNCCGGGFMDDKSEEIHTALNLRNLNKVKNMGYDKMATPCSVCLNSHRIAADKYEKDPELRENVDERLGRANIKYEGGVDSEHFIWVLIQDVGIDNIKSHVKKPLTGIKVGTYYGCQLLRPSSVMGFEPAHNPHSVMDLVAATGATPVAFPMKAACCGFPLMGSNPDVGLKMANNIFTNAKGNGAEMLVHPCSLCHLQLDATQLKIMDRFNQKWTMPTLYITQLIGLSFGYTPEQLGLGKIATNYLRSRGF
ncbi:CoB--CoM heterodisulfide reductase iron-sulfur subunit B family protein [Acidiplasma cupricumulans]|uniref:CoB--CoM heterodisulfide reductase iron-sulfur subunit B family protein n=1 Tax=Acidiplasma cupricumulans TaxID=312540 RepID=UPI00191C203D|nr:CoB--CoM heterodisulfide reductase iron-sulfur subunit B family protein [Acidiplasma cupricumulans]